MKYVGAGETRELDVPDPDRAIQRKARENEKARYATHRRPAIAPIEQWFVDLVSWRSGTPAADVPGAEPWVESLEPGRALVLAFTRELPFDDGLEDQARGATGFTWVALRKRVDLPRRD